MTIVVRYGNEFEMIKATVKALSLKHYGLSCIEISFNQYAYSWKIEEIEKAVKESILQNILELPIDLLKNHSWLGSNALESAKKRGDKVARELYLKSCNVENLITEVGLLYPDYYFISKKSGSFYNLQQVAMISQLIHVLNVVQCPKEEIDNVKFFEIE
jgi:hypothetical protein